MSTLSRYKDVCKVCCLKSHIIYLLLTLTAWSLWENIRRRSSMYGPRSTGSVRTVKNLVEYNLVPRLGENGIFIFIFIFILFFIFIFFSIFHFFFQFPFSPTLRQWRQNALCTRLSLSQQNFSCYNDYVGRTTNQSNCQVIQ